ncbi:Uncharacterised protein [Mesomycoplasma conjunctivae]|uniref:Uncharacterized protein n=1 Tax=Mesomycoplasma conjunctivae (strain ATCC 25834 / NCTC 10147 / HRC/581) TaxID=572263 RepID=C5J5Y3_MESCH|nr:hypothetical protein [Mesomycoplasma conjunctivae]CAT04875.1 HYPOTHETICAL PROTEIN MCJ_001820 [Mesomycoplasma conjunctivae]VEU65960.1 Uncharacterised protein [Mesomycoplasma conjunctivae]
MFGFFTGIINAITYPFFLLGWYLFVYIPLALIAFFNLVFQQLGLEIIVRVIFQKGKFSFQDLPVGFWVFVFVALAMGFVLFVAKFVKFLVARKENPGEEIVSMTRGVFVSFAFAFLFPILLFASLIILQMLLDLVNQYVRGNSSLTYLIVKSSTDKISESEVVRISKDFRPPGYDSYTRFHSGEAIQLVLTLGIASLVISFILGISFISWFVAGAQLFMNFLTMPLWIANSIWDNGKQIKLWVKSFFGQLASLIVYQTSFNIFLIWLSSTLFIADSMNFREAGSNEFLYKFFVKLAFIIGGGIAIITFTKQIASQFGQGNLVGYQQRLASSALKVAGVSAGAIGGFMLKMRGRSGDGNKKANGIFSDSSKILPSVNGISSSQSQGLNWRGLMMTGLAVGSGIAAASQGTKMWKRSNNDEQLNIKHNKTANQNKEHSKTKQNPNFLLIGNVDDTIKSTSVNEKNDKSKTDSPKVSEQAWNPSKNKLKTEEKQIESTQNYDPIINEQAKTSISSPKIKNNSQKEQEKTKTENDENDKSNLTKKE